MKKVMFALAIAGMFSFAACGNSEPATEAQDSVDSIAPVEETVMDSAVVDSAATTEAAPVEAAK